MARHQDGGLALLRCPVCCVDGLYDRGDQVVCTQGHAFNRARQGYLDLLGPGGTPHQGDTAAMLDARTRFLGSGVFDPISYALGKAAVAALEWRDPAWDPVVLEAGGGTGHHLGRVLDALDASGLTGGRTRAVLTDVSVYAVRRAARALDPAYAPLVLRTDVWADWPLVDGAVDLALVVFAPRNAAELTRTVDVGGGLLVVTPGPDHLGELTRTVGGLRVHPDKQERLVADLAAGFEHLGTRPVTYAVTLDVRQSTDALAMGPSAAHLDVEALPDLLGDGERTVTVDVRLDVFRRRTG